MDNMAMDHLRDLYGLNPNIPHLAFQFPRLPPRLPNHMFKTRDPARERFLNDAEGMMQKLQGFQHMYQQHAAGLLDAGLAVIPPGHPAYTGQNSIKSLRTENDKLLKENLELRKKLDKESSS